MTKILPLYHLSIHPQQFSHSADGFSMFLRNVRTFKDYTEYKHERRPSSNG